jgi:ATP-binding cassette subfamily B protein
VNLAVTDRLNKVWSLFTPTVSLLTGNRLLVVVWAFGDLMSKQQITVGVLTAFIAYIGCFGGGSRLDEPHVPVTRPRQAHLRHPDHVSTVPGFRN